MMAKKKQPSPDVIEPEEIGELIPLMLQLEQWTIEFRKFLVQQLENGMDIPGADLVTKTNMKRVWKEDLPDPELIKILQAAMKKMKKPARVEDVAPKVVLTVAGAESKLGKAAFRDLLSDQVEKKTTSTSVSLVLS